MHPTYIAGKVCVVITTKTNTRLYVARFSRHIYITNKYIYIYTCSNRVRRLLITLNKHIAQINIK